MKCEECDKKDKRIAELEAFSDRLSRYIDANALAKLKAESGEVPVITNGLLVFSKDRTGRRRKQTVII